MRPVLLLLLLAASARAVEVRVDPRFELLGVLRELSGEGKALPDAAAYRDEVRVRFAPYRRHKAVKAVRKYSSDPEGRDALARALLFYSPPPELALLDEKADVPVLRDKKSREKFEKVLGRMRDFARDSRFAGFFAEKSGFYSGVEARSREAFGTLDPAAELEAYVGMPLASRVHYVRPLLDDAAPNYVIPYPLPHAAPDAESFDVYTVCPAYEAGSLCAWIESVWVFVDPAVYTWERLGGRALSQKEKSAVAEAIIARLSKRSGLDAGYKYSPEVAALAARLEEYEKDRKRWPTLWSFLPSLLGEPERSLPPAARIGDLFAVSKKLGRR